MKVFSRFIAKIMIFHENKAECRRWKVSKDEETAEWLHHKAFFLFILHPERRHPYSLYAFLCINLCTIFRANWCFGQRIMPLFVYNDFRIQFLYIILAILPIRSDPVRLLGSIVSEPNPSSCTRCPSHRASVMAVRRASHTSFTSVGVAVVAWLMSMAICSMSTFCGKATDTPVHRALLFEKLILCDGDSMCSALLESIHHYGARCALNSLLS